MKLNRGILLKAGLGISFILLCTIIVLGVYYEGHKDDNGSVLPTITPPPSVVCPRNAKYCAGTSPSPDQPVFPGTDCCCNSGYEPSDRFFRCNKVRCGFRKFACYGQSPSPSEPVVPGTNCCCETGFYPNRWGNCRRLGCRRNTFYCNGESPGSDYPHVPGTNCCCLKGYTPNPNGNGTCIENLIVQRVRP